MIGFNTDNGSVHFIQKDKVYELCDVNNRVLLTYTYDEEGGKIERKVDFTESDSELLDKLHPLLKPILDSNRVGLEYDAADDTSDAEIEDDPFNPEDISIDTKGVAMDTLLRRLEQGTILLNPDFQRQEVWDDERKSQLIESLILKIPIPMFYVSCDEKGVWTVVDGLQRLSTIRDFVLGKKYLEDPTLHRTDKGNGMILKKLEFWKDLNGLCFNKLPQHLYNRISETEFKFTIINPGTPEDVKRNVFKRLNTGGMPLSSQEIRNALYTGKSTTLLNQLSSLTVFKEATCNSIRSERMEDKELILRFVAFTVRSYTMYTKTFNIDTWLSDTMIILNALPNLDTKEFLKTIKSGSIVKEQINSFTDEEIRIRFELAMTRSKVIFGEHAFRKSYAGKRRSPINKSLFETWSVILGNLTNTEFATLKNNKRDFLKAYKPLMDDWDFIIEISRDSMKHTAVKSRFEKLGSLVKQFTIE